MRIASLRIRITMNEPVNSREPRHTANMVCSRMLVDIANVRRQGRPKL